LKKKDALEDFFVKTGLTIILLHKTVDTVVGYGEK
jgi:hypothetical protein